VNLIPDGNDLFALEISVNNWSNLTETLPVFPSILKILEMFWNRRTLEDGNAVDNSSTPFAQAAFGKRLPALARARIIPIQSR